MINSHRRIHTSIAICLFTSSLIVAGVFLLSQLTGKPLSWLTRDPLTLSNSVFYIGILSNLGILLWSAVTAICFFGYVMIRRQKRCPRYADFLLFSGFFSLVLTLDDTFLFHDRLLPVHLNIPEICVFVGYAMIIIFYLVSFYRLIFEKDYILFVIALFFLGSSYVLDQLLSETHLEIFIEDALKFCGIVFWLAYFAQFAAVRIAESIKVREGEISDPEISEPQP